MRDYNTARARSGSSSSKKKRSAKKTRRGANSTRKQQKKRAGKPITSDAGISTFQSLKRWFIGFFTTVLVVVVAVFFLSFNIATFLPLENMVMMAFKTPGAEQAEYLVSFLPESRLVVYSDVTNQDDSLFSTQFASIALESSIGPMSSKEEVEKELYLLLQEVISNTFFINEHSERAENLDFFDTLVLYAFVREPKTQFVESTQRNNPLAVYVSESSETCSIAVINAVGISGLAGEVSDVLSNAGLTVIRVDSELENSPDRSQVLLDPEMPECEEWALFAGSVIPDFSEELYEDTEKTNQYRSSVVIILGDDFKQEF